MFSLKTNYKTLQIEIYFVLLDKKFFVKTDSYII